MQTINLNMTSGGVPPVVHLSQFDYKKQYALMLYNGDEEYTIPTGATVAVCGTKRDKHPFYYDSTNQPEVVSYDGSTVTITTPVQMTACNGNTPTEIKIEADGATLYSANYVMDIEKSALPSDEELSDIDVALIIKAIEGGEAVAGIDDKIAQATEILSHMNDNVEQSDKDVELANASATAAKTSETNAKAYEESASASASSASTSATNASASASSAKTSETNASASATNAATSESNAKTSETNAKASETASATSEANAQASAESASASAQAAKNSQSSASGYATQAKNQATAAATSATNASTSETNAKTSETNAAQSASEAKASAENNEKWAEQSESYAVGGTSTRTGEDEDNSKYYKDLAKQYAAQAQAAVTGVSFTIVTSLPATGADGVFYLIAHSHGSGDSYDEYVWLKDQGKFERIGSTDVDLTDYVKRSDTATTAQNGTMSASDKAKLDGVATGATKVTVDDALSSTSSNPVANKAIQSALDAMDEAIETKATASDLTALTSRVTATESGLSDMSDAITADEKKITAHTSDINTLKSGKADKATTLSGYGITDAYTKTETDTALSTKADSTTVETLQTEGKFTVSASNWSSTTVTVNGGTYYTYTLSCTDVAMEHPIIGISGATNIPTADEQTAYDCLSYAVADTTANTITLYAETLPTVSFYIIVKGAK